jgi:FtsH-binding integral membrane protein
VVFDWIRFCFWYYIIHIDIYLYVFMNECVINVMTGLGLGPLMDYVIMVDPSIIPTAFLSTCVIFGCFSLSAMLSDHRKWLYLGGTLMSFLSLLMFMSIINLFIGSKLLFQVFFNLNTFF